MLAHSQEGVFAVVAAFWCLMHQLQQCSKAGNAIYQVMASITAAEHCSGRCFSCPVLQGNTSGEKCHVRDEDQHALLEVPAHFLYATNAKSESMNCMLCTTLLVVVYNAFALAVITKSVL